MTVCTFSGSMFQQMLIVLCCCLQAVSSIRQSVDLTRLSRIALSNLEKDEGVTDYMAAQPAAGGDITIDSTDAELDFQEAHEDGECCRTPWGGRAAGLA